jgi:tetratricopeptide (TPR) repeat protein
MKFLILIALIISSEVHARWATRNELPYVMLNDETEVSVKKDGTYVVIQTGEYEIQNEAGKSRFSIYQIPFNSSYNKVSILEAKVTNGNSVYPYDKTKVVERSDSKDNGISDLKTIQIPLSNLQIGSKIFVKFKMETTQAIVPGHFSMTFRMGEINQADNAIFKIDSELPLEHLENDPFNVLSMREQKKDGRYFYQGTLTEPYLKLPVEEAGSIDQTKLTFLKFSTDKDWNKISTNLKSGFEKVLSDKLPDEFLPLISELQKLKSLEEKVNHLLGYMTEKYNYLGDWRTLSGGFSPRKLSEISSTKFGDCKDFSVLTARILREINIKSDIAIVFRGPGPVARVNSYVLPSMDIFNHAIVRIEDKDKIFWIDPTNKLSFGLNHRQDISGRPALNLMTGLLGDIPLNTAERTSVKISKVVTFENENSGNVTGSISFSGSYSLFFREQGVGKDLEKAKTTFLHFFKDGENSIIPDVIGFSNDSRKYSKIDLSINYSASDLSTQKEDYHFGVLANPTPLLHILAQDTKNWVGDLYIGEQQEFIRSTTLKGIFAAKRPRGCNISTEWVDYKRLYDFTTDGLILNEHLVYKKEFIPQDKFKSTEFELLQSNIFSCIGERTVKFKWGSKAHADSEEQIDKKFAKLPLKERLNSRLNYVREAREDLISTGFSDYDLIYFLKKNIKENPSHYESYRLWSNIELMEGYLNGSNFNKANVEEAQRILFEGLHHSPNNTHLLVEFLKHRIYLGEKDSIEAEADRLSLRDDIQEIHTLVSLAKIYENLSITKKSLATLGRALKLAKTNLEKKSVWFRLATSYSDSQDNEKCIGAYNQVLKLDPKDSYTHINVVNCLINAKKFDEAVKRSRDGLKVTSAGMMNYNAARAYNKRGNYYLELRKFNEAESDFKQSLLLRQSSDPYSGLAEVAISRGDYDRAIALVNEGVQYHQGNKTRFVNYIGHKLSKLSPDHFKKLTGTAMDHSQNVVDKLWGIYKIGTSLHQQKKREELYLTLEKGLDIGEQIMKSGKLEGEVMYAIGSIYALYGTDSDNDLLLNKAIMHLRFAKELKVDAAKIDNCLKDIERVKSNIKSGRFLNLNTE